MRRFGWILLGLVGCVDKSPRETGDSSDTGSGPAAFEHCLGDYAGNFDGDEQGTAAFTIDALGYVQGVFTLDDESTADVQSNFDVYTGELRALSHDPPAWDLSGQADESCAIAGDWTGTGTGGAFQGTRVATASTP